MIDVAVSADENISLEQFQKFSKDKDLEIEVIKIWKFKTKTVPVVIGALGMIKKETITTGIAENSTHKYCSHIMKTALSVSKHTAISNIIITSKYFPLKQ